MILVNKNSDYNSSDDDDDWSSPFDFTLPDCSLPDFLDNPLNWRQCVFETNTLHLWCDFMTKLENYSPLYISENDVKIIIHCMIDDIVYMYGITTFFPTGPCEDCGVIHSVNIFEHFSS